MHTKLIPRFHYDPCKSQLKKFIFSHGISDRNNLACCCFVHQVTIIFFQYQLRKKIRSFSLPRFLITILPVFKLREKLPIMIFSSHALNKNNYCTYNWNFLYLKNSLQFQIFRWRYLFPRMNHWGVLLRACNTNERGRAVKHNY